jgi:hypothetical protein
MRTYEIAHQIPRRIIGAIHGGGDGPTAGAGAVTLVVPRTPSSSIGGCRPEETSG